MSIIDIGLLFYVSTFTAYIVTNFYQIKEMNKTHRRILCKICKKLEIKVDLTNLDCED